MPSMNIFVSDIQNMFMQRPTNGHIQELHSPTDQQGRCFLSNVNSLINANSLSSWSGEKSKKTDGQNFHYNELGQCRRHQLKSLDQKHRASLQHAPLQAVTELEFLQHAVPHQCKAQEILNIRQIVNFQLVCRAAHK